jgi:small subunit ribosomal protein S20
LAHSRSARKSLRVAQRQALENRGIRSSVRTYFRKAQQSVAHKADEAADLVRLAVSQLDKAATKHVMHANQAARRKSRLMHRLAVLQASSATTETGEAAAATPRRRTTRAAAAEKPAAPARARRTPAPVAEAAPAPRRRRTASS